MIYNHGTWVSQEMEVDGEIQLLEIPKGEYLVGSFEIFPTEDEDAWNEMLDFIKRDQIKPMGGIMYESYKNDAQTLRKESILWI